MRVLTLDYSYSKTGICVSEIRDGKIYVLLSKLVVSNKELEPIERIDRHINDIKEIIDKYKPNVICKEEPFVGRAATAKYVLYAHAVLEYVLYIENKEIQDIHNATLKAYCRKYLIDKYFYTKEELKQFNKKEIVAEFLKSYFSSDMKEIYTERGKLLDDVSDAIALSIYYHEHNKDGM